MFSTTTKAKDTILEGELTQVETTPFRGCSAVLVGGSAPAFKYGPLGGKKKAMEVIDIASVASVAGEENEFAIVTIHGSRTVFAAGSQRESQRWADERQRWQQQEVLLPTQPKQSPRTGTPAPFPPPMLPCRGPGTRVVW